MNRLNFATSWDPNHSLDGESQSKSSNPKHQIGCDPEDDNGPVSYWGSSLQAQTFFIPIHYEANYKYPLIVWLHSDGFNENQVCQVMPHVSSRNYVATGIRAPKAADSGGHRYAWGHTVAAMESAEFSVLEAIRRTCEQYSINQQRVVLAGYHEGATMAMQIGMRHPSRFAAVAALGGRFELPPASVMGVDELRECRLQMLWQRSILSDSFDDELLLQEVQHAADIRARLEVRQYRSDDEMNTAVLGDFDRWVMERVVNGASQDRVLWDSSPTAFSDN